MRSNLAVLLCAYFATMSSCGGATVYVDASVGGTTFNNVLWPGPFPLNIYAKPLYTFNSGDTVDFGTLLRVTYLQRNQSPVSSFGLITGWRVSFGAITGTPRKRFC